MKSELHLSETKEVPEVARMLRRTSPGHWVSNPSTRKDIPYNMMRLDSANTNAYMIVTLCNDNVICCKLLEGLGGSINKIIRLSVRLLGDTGLSSLGYGTDLAVGVLWKVSP